VRTNIETSFAETARKRRRAVDVTVGARHTISVAMLSPQTILTITGQATMNSDEAVVGHCECLSHNRIPPATSPHRSTDADRVGEFENIEATASGY